MRDRFNRSAVAKLSLKPAQNEEKQSKSLSYGWQTDSVEFSVRWRIDGFTFQDRRFQPLTHSSVSNSNARSKVATAFVLEFLAILFSTLGGALGREKSKVQARK